MRKGVQKLYKNVASTYEIVNHVATFGMDIQWRKRAVKGISAPKGQLWLDVCCGTGEMSQNLAKRAKNDTRIYSVDFSYSMISYAKKKRYDQKVFFALADVGFLPFPDETFDLVTISFSTRNLNLTPNEMQSHLTEFHRILKPQGQFLNLETSQPSSRLLRKAFHFYVRKIVEPVGSIISGSRSGYKYLAYTIPRFYSRDEFTALLRQTGFSEVQSQSLLLGISSIHLAIK
jgi:demethylmenaquinone methyltransferase/2-methoxy-6-polyprenyl-1,4-benzoquinol methylase